MRAIFSFLCFIVLLAASAPRAHASTVELPCDFHANLVWLKVTVPCERAPLQFLLDSGAGASVIEADTARRLGLRAGGAQTVRGVGAKATAFRVSGFSGETGGLPVASDLLALDLQAISRAVGRRIDGLVGADFLRRRIVQIDYTAKKVRVLDRAPSAGPRGETLPLVLRGDALSVRVAVGGTAPAWMRVDTGCDAALRWVVSATAAQKLAASSSSSVALSTGAGRTLSTAVQLGALTIPGVKTALHSTPIFPGESGLLGNGLLSQFTVTFDSAHRQLILTR